MNGLNLELVRRQEKNNRFLMEICKAAYFQYLSVEAAVVDYESKASSLLLHCRGYMRFYKIYLLYLLLLEYQEKIKTETFNKIAGENLNSVASKLLATAYQVKKLIGEVREMSGIKGTFLETYTEHIFNPFILPLCNK